MLLVKSTTVKPVEKAKRGRSLNLIGFTCVVIGGGHYEMNLIRAFVDLNWKPYYEKFADSLGFRSDKAKTFIM